MSCGIKMHSSGERVSFEPNSDDVQGGGSYSCSAALSSVDDFSYDQEGKVSTAEDYTVDSETFARIGVESVGEDVPRVPPSADLGGGSQEPGHGRGDDGKDKFDKNHESIIPECYSREGRDGGDAYVADGREPNREGVGNSSSRSTMLDASGSPVNDLDGHGPDGTADGAGAVRKRGKPNKAA